MQNMDPVFRDEYVEDVLESFIRGPEGEPDVTEWMNNSGEGDPELEIGRASCRERVLRLV